MKVTVAFGDVKVVVPCGNGDITIRQLSELAITRYQKSLQQMEFESNLPRMSVNINALVLARDCGILDWDDSVSDVVDDRELIIARFQNKPTSCNNNNNSKHLESNSNVILRKSGKNNHYFCSEWKYCVPNTSLGKNPRVVSNSDEKIPCNPSSIGKHNSTGDTVENSGNLHCGKNGSYLISISPESVDSSQRFGENINADPCCNAMSSENISFWNQRQGNKGSFSLEESDSSQWPVPPPLIVSTSEDSILLHKPTYCSVSNVKCCSLANRNDHSCHGKPFELLITKKYPFPNMAKPTYKINHDTLPTTSSQSPSLPSNADAKSLPQSFYSSLDSTAVSDNNNSSYDETNNEDVGDTSISTSINQIEDKTNNDQFLKIKSGNDVSQLPGDTAGLTESNSNKANSSDAMDETAECNLSDIPEENSSNRSQKYNSIFPQMGYNSVSSTCSKMSSSLQYQPQMPPPMPPLRSAFTKLSPNPITVSIPPVNFLQVSDTDLTLPSESMACIQLISKTSAIQPKSSELSKSEHSIPSLFESDDRIPEDMENEWSISGKSADQESIATTTTTETSVNTTTTATTNSHNILNKTNEKYVLTVTLKKSPNGFGFSLTSRQNPVDLTNPVYVSKVLENGPAIFDGRMRSGDRIVMINDEDVSQLSQKNIKDILLNIPAESVVKIGLVRPSSDAISNLLDAKNTASNNQKKNSIPQVLNHTGDKEFNEDCNQICVEEQKPVSFPMCSCLHKNSQPCSKLSLYHFIIPLRTAKSDYLSPQFFERPSSENIPKTLTVRNQNAENKTEPPAIPLNHQNKLSSCSYSNKSQSMSKASNAALGISVRRGISQMSFNDSHSDCQNECQDPQKSYNSSNIPNQELSESFAPNNYMGNVEESVHKFCPNCHGLLFLKNGVFVKSIIPGGAAHMDARVLTGDEIIAVQGVCLHNGEDFLPPNNKVLLGDVYDSLKFAQVPLKFHNRIQNTNSINSKLDSNERIDPLTLLKQILSHAQSICSSVSLTILRRSLEQRSCSINTLASVDANCCHNVTVAADVHAPYRNEDLKAENLLSHIMPANLPSTGLPGVSTISRQRIERFEDYHNRDHNQRYYRDDRDDSVEIHTSDLICLQSDHGSDDPIPAVVSENNSMPSPSHTNNASLADSYHVSSGILTDFEKVRVPRVITTIYNDSSPVGSSVDNLATLRHANINSKVSHSASSDLNTDVNFIEYHGAEFDNSYFTRNDSTRKSFSQKRNFAKPHFSIKNYKSSISHSSVNSHFNGKSKKANTLCRPVSELVLYQVPEEDSIDSMSPTPIQQHQFEYETQTIDRRLSLRSRSGVNKFEDKNRYRS